MMAIEDYFIEMLQKVSFDKYIFLKELQKSRRWLKPDEYAKVLKWANDNYIDKFEQGEKIAEYEHFSKVN